MEIRPRQSLIDNVLPRGVLEGLTGIVLPANLVASWVSSTSVLIRNCVMRLVGM
jgi:hypothetical protein